VMIAESHITHASILNRFFIPHPCVRLSRSAPLAFPSLPRPANVS
jgi:hypothetical protein